MKKDEQKKPEREVKEPKVSREISQEELEQVTGGIRGIGGWTRPVRGGSL